MFAALALVAAFNTGTPLQARSDHMDWWREAKFGMFVHWGLYAIPAGEWQGKPIGGIGEWIYNSAKAEMSDYEKLQPQFNPTQFNAAEFVSAAKGAGMKYIVITSKHHDGFSLFDSKETEWDVMATPFKRDILLELSKECTKQGVKLCFYYSIMDWHHKDYALRRAWDARPELGEPDMDKYVAFMKAQLKELVSGKYGKIGILWFDGEWESAWTHQRGVDLYNYVKSLDKDVIVNNRVDKGRSGMAGLTVDGFVGEYGTPEQEIPPTGLPGVDWESCMTMNDTWGFKKDDENWKSTEQLLFNLIDCVSKGGNFLLNVGPTAEGLIPKPSLARLKEMGGYVSVNAEAIYGAGPSPFAKLPYRVTRKPGRLYVHVFRAEPGMKIELTGLQNRVKRAYALNDPKVALNVSGAIGPAEARHAIVSLQGVIPNKVMTTICVEYEGSLIVVTPPLMPDKDGVLTLNAIDAKINGSSAKLEGHGENSNIGFWTNERDFVTWEFELHEAGWYSCTVEYASIQSADLAKVIYSIGDRNIPREMPATGGWQTYRKMEVGLYQFPGRGKYTLTVRPLELRNGFLMNLKRLVLRPVPPLHYPNGEGARG